MTVECHRFLTCFQRNTIFTEIGGTYEPGEEVYRKAAWFLRTPSQQLKKQGGLIMKKSGVYFIKNKTAAAGAVLFGKVTVGHRVIFCSCGCGQVQGAQDGWVLKTAYGRTELGRLGLKVSAINFCGNY